LRRRERPITGLLPQAKPSEERIGVLARPASARQLFQFFAVTSPQNYVVGLEAGDQAGNYLRLGTISPGLQRATAPLSAALLDVITAISSFQD
jgi:hypothetical protein